MARLPTMSLVIHPSSSLHYIDSSPRWIVYQHVMTTSKSFLLNATPVDETWVWDAVHAKKITFSMDALSDQLLVRHPIHGVGGSCFKKLKQNRAAELKNLVECVKSNAEVNAGSCKVVIDAFTEYGSVILYAQNNVMEQTVNCVKSYLDDVKDSLKREVIEKPVAQDDRSVRYILRDGGEIQTIMMANETRQVRVTLHEAEFDVLSSLRRFGEIQRVDRTTVESGMWGYVTFYHGQAAIDALKALKGSVSDAYSIEPSGLIDRSTFTRQERSLDFGVKVVAVRRQHKGFGFVAFEDVEDMFHVTAKLDTLTV